MNKTFLLTLLSLLCFSCFIQCSNKNGSTGPASSDAEIESLSSGAVNNGSSNDSTPYGLLLTVEIDGVDTTKSGFGIKIDGVLITSAPYIYTVGDAATLEAVHPYGYSFIEWVPSLSSDMDIDIGPPTLLVGVPESGGTLKAVFETLTYDVTVTNGVGGDSILIDGSKFVGPNDTNTYTIPGYAKYKVEAALPEIGWEFAGWEVTGGVSVESPSLTVTKFYPTTAAGTIKAKYTMVTKGDFTDDRDGQSYPWLRIDTKNLPGSAAGVGDSIGQLIWMGKNLNYHYVNPEDLNDQDSSFCFGDIPENCTKYGHLYTPTVAVDSACPAGWRLPTDEDWKSLERHAGMDAAEADKTSFRNTNGEADKLKSSTAGTWVNFPGTNNFGFNIIPTGYLDITNNSGYIELTGVNSKTSFWTATPRPSVVGSYYKRTFYDDDYNEIERSSRKLNGLSVRCVR